jgi:hypothetical protein
VNDNTTDITSDEAAEARAEHVAPTKEHTDQTLREHGLFMLELLKSDRFQELMKIYFTLQMVVNDMDKTVTYQVIENPPEEIAKRMKERQDSAKKVEIATPEQLKALKKFTGKRKGRN